MAYRTAEEAFVDSTFLFTYGELMWCFGKIKTKLNISDWDKSNYKKIAAFVKSN